MESEEYLYRVFVSISNKIHSLQLYVERNDADVCLFNDTVSCLDHITFFCLFGATDPPPPLGLALFF